MSLFIIISIVSLVAFIIFLGVQSLKSNSYKGFANSTIDNIKNGQVSDEHVTDIRAAIEQDLAAKTRK